MLVKICIWHYYRSSKKSYDLHVSYDHRAEKCNVMSNNCSHGKQSSQQVRCWRRTNKSCMDERWSLRTKMQVQKSLKAATQLTHPFKMDHSPGNLRAPKFGSISPQKALLLRRWVPSWDIFYKRFYGLSSKLKWNFLDPILGQRPMSTVVFWVGCSIPNLWGYDMDLLHTP